MFLLGKKKRKKEGVRFLKYTKVHTIQLQYFEHFQKQWAENLEIAACSLSILL